MKKTINLSIVLFVIVAASIAFFTSWAVIEVCKPGKTPAVTIEFPNTIQTALPSVVHIMCDRWQASGVAISEDIVVTARHVIDGLNYAITWQDGGRTITVDASQAMSSKKYDIGFIKLDGKVLKPAKFGSIKECVLGQPVFIIGSPYGKINFNNVTLGIISGLDRDWDKLSRWGEPYGWKIAFTSDSGAHPGNSGGPVFSMDGKVRGLLVGGYSPVLNCSMPSDLFMGDIEIIKLMFAFNKYKQEEVRAWDGYSQSYHSGE